MRKKFAVYVNGKFRARVGHFGEVVSKLGPDDYDAPAGKGGFGRVHVEGRAGMVSWDATIIFNADPDRPEGSVIWAHHQWDWEEGELSDVANSLQEAMDCSLEAVR